MLEEFELKELINTIFGVLSNKFIPASAVVEHSFAAH